jgi:hypothetical protein
VPFLPSPSITPVLRWWAFWKGRGVRARLLQAVVALCAVLALLVLAWAVAYYGFACQTSSC